MLKGYVKLWVERGLNFGPTTGFSTMTMLQLSVKRFSPQKSITEMEHPPCSPHSALNDFWLFPKIKCLKGVLIPAGAGSFSVHHRVQTGSGALPVSYPMGTRCSFPGDKAARAWSWPLTSIRCRAQRMNGAILHSPVRLHGLVLRDRDNFLYLYLTLLYLFYNSFSHRVTREGLICVECPDIRLL
jgi:hypothetical protein